MELVSEIKFKALNAVNPLLTFPNESSLEGQSRFYEWIWKQKKKLYVRFMTFFGSFPNSVSDNNCVHQHKYPALTLPLLLCNTIAIREWTFMTIHDTPKISCHQNAISVLVITQNITKMVFKLCAISRAEQQENIFLTTVAPKLLAIKQRRHHHVLRF